MYVCMYAINGILVEYFVLQLQLNLYEEATYYALIAPY